MFIFFEIINLNIIYIYVDNETCFFINKKNFDSIYLKSLNSRKFRKIKYYL